MKKFNYKLVAVALLAGLLACSEDTLDRINENPNDPTDVASRLILTEMMTSTAFSVVGADLAFYASVYTELNVGIYGQMYNAEIRVNEPSSSSTYNNSWNSIYQNLYGLKIVIEKCSEGGEEEGNFHNLGIAQILTAYNLAVLTDVAGDVPYTEALQPGVIFTPVLDRQQDLYTEIFNLLDAAIENLNMDTEFSGLGTQDFFYYNGSESVIANWIKFAEGLKARYTMRLSAISPDYDAVISYVDASFASPAEQCQFNYNGSTSRSPFKQFFDDRDYFGASASLHAKLSARDDPRDSLYFTPYEGADELVFAPSGSPQQVQGLYSVSALSIVTAPTYILSYHELQFLKAEAYARKNDLTNAQAALRLAVVAAMGKVNVGVSAADAEAYFDAEVVPRLSSQSAAINEIAVQKYLAFYEEEAVEAYNDIRRWKAMGSNPISLSNPLKFPLRFTYGSSDVTTNPNVRQAYGDGSYVYIENVWWAGGSR